MVLGRRKAKNIEERKLAFVRQISQLKKESEGMTWQDQKQALQATVDRLVTVYLNHSR